MTATLVPDSDPILHKSSAIISDEKFANHGAELKPIAALLIEQIYTHNALGISACQIGIDLAMFAFDDDGNIRVCCNPQIVAAVASFSKEKEGCLSYPGLTLNVKRPTSAIVRYKDIEGIEVTEQLEGMAARIFLHEYDHTIGTCFVNRVSKLSLDMAKKKKDKFSKRSSK